MVVRSKDKNGANGGGREQWWTYGSKVDLGYKI